MHFFKWSILGRHISFVRERFFYYINKHRPHHFPEKSGTPIDDKKVVGEEFRKVVCLCNSTYTHIHRDTATINLKVMCESKFGQLMEAISLRFFLEPQPQAQPFTSVHCMLQFRRIRRCRRWQATLRRSSCQCRSPRSAPIWRPQVLPSPPLPRPSLSSPQAGSGPLNFCWANSPA